MGGAEVYRGDIMDGPGGTSSWHCWKKLEESCGGKFLRNGELLRSGGASLPLGCESPSYLGCLCEQNPCLVGPPLVKQRSPRAACFLQRRAVECSPRYELRTRIGVGENKDTNKNEYPWGGWVASWLSG